MDTEAAFGAGIAGRWVPDDNAIDSGTFISLGDYKVVRYNVTLGNSTSLDTSHVHLIRTPFETEAIVDGQLGDAFGGSLVGVLAGFAFVAGMVTAAILLFRRAWLGVRDRKLRSIAKVERILKTDELVQSVITATTDVNRELDDMMLVATNQRYLVFAMTLDRRELDPRVYPRATRLDAPKGGTLETTAFGDPVWIRGDQLVAASLADAALDRQIAATAFDASTESPSSRP